MTARDDAAGKFTAVRRGRARTYHVTDKTRFVVGGAQGSWRIQGRHGGASEVASCGQSARGRHRRH